MKLVHRVRFLGCQVIKMFWLIILHLVVKQSQYPSEADHKVTKDVS